MYYYYYYYNTAVITMQVFVYRANLSCMAMRGDPCEVILRERQISHFNDPCFVHRIYREETFTGFR